MEEQGKVRLDTFTSYDCAQVVVVVMVILVPVMMMTFGALGTATGVTSHGGNNLVRARICDVRTILADAPSKPLLLL